MKTRVWIFIATSACVVATTAWSSQTHHMVSDEVSESVSGFAATCPIPKTGQTISIRGGDDGDHEAGMTWPPPRFTDNSDGTVADNLTGLEWIQAPHSLIGNSDVTNWNHAIDFCNGLNYAGHSDWRLPNVRELESLVHYGADSPLGWLNSSETPFSLEGISGDLEYFSSTSYNETIAIVVYMNGHGVETYFKNWMAYVWPVRGGDPSTPAPIPKTGQTISYRTGDDGDLKTGVAWPGPRFTDNSDGTVADNLTGLEWIKETHLLSGNSSAMNWDSAIDFCNGLNYAGHSDWRLPNVREMSSLLSFGSQSPALPTEHPFSGVQPDDWYWTGSLTMYDGAWSTYMGYAGWWEGDYRTSIHYVWPVRGGQLGYESYGAPITNCYPIASGFVLEWIPEAGWDSVVHCSTNLITMPFTDLSGVLPYPVNSYTDTVTGADGKCFYKVELEP